MPRKWLQRLIDQYIPAIARLEDTPEGRVVAQERSQWMKDQWAKHGLKALKQQRNLMTDVRNAMKQRLGSDHWALELMNFSTAEWTLINEPIEDQAAFRNENQVLLDPGSVNAIVYRAVNLLMSREWAEIAAALAVLTGRRSSEILSTAWFEPKTEYSVIFTGALKRKGEGQILRFEIPTLSQAQYVITALEKLRQMVPAQGWSAEMVNQRYSGAVAKVCDRNFADLVPKREGRSSLYTHLFRSVYAAIATYFYCPLTVDSMEFKAAIQGHYAVLDAKNPVLRRSLAASRHYSDYKVVEADGSMRQGVKLGLPGVQVIEVFQKQQPVQSQEQVKSSFSEVLTTVTEAPDAEWRSNGTASRGSIKVRENGAMKSKKVRAEDLSVYELIMFSDAYERALQRGFKGNSDQFRYQAKKYPQRVSQNFGLQRDELVDTPQGVALSPTWRDLHVLVEQTPQDEAIAQEIEAEPVVESEVRPVATVSKAATPEAVQPRVERPAARSHQAQQNASLQDALTPDTPLGQLAMVQNLSTGIDFLTREIEQARQDRDVARQECDRALAQLGQKDHEISELQQQVLRLQGELAELRTMYQDLEPILQLVGRAQDRLASVTESPAVSEPQAKGQAPSQVQETSQAIAAATRSTHLAEGQSRSIAKEDQPKSQRSPLASSNKDLDPHVVQALNAIFDYNNTPGRSYEEKWAISYPVMKDLCAQLGVATQPKIKAVFDAFEEEIDRHHSAHGLGARHNRNHSGHSINEVIQLK